MGYYLDIGLVQFFVFIDQDFAEIHNWISLCSGQNSGRINEVTVLTEW